MPPDDREALRQQLLANGASPIAAAWRVGDRIEDLPPDPIDLDRVARDQQAHARDAAGTASPVPAHSQPADRTTEGKEINHG